MKSRTRPSAVACLRAAPAVRAGAGALFLPLHFWVLSMAVTDAAQLDAFLTLTEMPLVKAAEFGLVFLLAVHLFGGLRLIALEWLPWSAPQKTWAAAAVAGSFLVSTTFLMQAI